MMPYMMTLKLDKLFFAAGLSIAVVSSLVFGGDEKTLRASALGDSYLGEFYRVDELSSASPGVLIRHETLPRF